MPGLHVAVPAPPQDRPLPAFQPLSPETSARRRAISLGEGVLAHLDAPDDYPYLTLAGPGFRLLLDGIVYDRSEREIGDLAAAVTAALRAGEPVEDRVRGFLEAADGEYVVALAVDEPATLLVWNDPWARLPLYVAEAPGRFLLGREPQDLLPHLPAVRFDRGALAEWLAFEYTVNPAWLVEGVEHVPPATLFTVRREAGRVRVSRTALRVPDFRATRAASQRRTAVRTYAGMLLESLSRRVAALGSRGLRLTADVSGGLDTRCVLAAARRLGAPLEFFTDELVTGDESAVALRLGEAAGVSVARVPQPPFEHDAAAWRRVTYLTGGRVNVRTAMGSQLLTRARRAALAGPAARFMGFGGELARKPYGPPHGYRSFAAALADDLYTRSVSLEEAPRLVGLAPAAVRQRLAGAVERYPDRRDEDRARRLYLDYYLRIVNAGEDRQRWYFWTATPLWARPLVDFAYRSSPARTHGYPFLIDVLREVYPPALTVPLHRRAVDLASRRSVRAFDARQHLLARLRSDRRYWSLKRTLSPRERWARVPGEQERAWILAQVAAAFADSEAVRDTFDRAVVNGFLRPDRPAHQLHQLLTALFFVAEAGSRLRIAR